MPPDSSFTWPLQAPGFAQADKEAPEALLRVDNTVLLGKITTTCLSQSEGLKELIADTQLSSWGPVEHVLNTMSQSSYPTHSGPVAPGAQGCDLPSSSKCCEAWVTVVTGWITLEVSYWDVYLLRADAALGKPSWWWICKDSGPWEFSVQPY